MITPLAARRGLITPLARGIRRESAAWWLSGGISAANCIAAYQPRGAADYAASKINLANPGTYNAIDGTAYPAWDAINGWKFNAGSSQFLNTGITSAFGYSMIIRFSNVTNATCILSGTYDYYSQDLFYISPNISSKVYYGFGNGLDSEIGVSPNISSGVLAIAGNLGYRNGSLDATGSTGDVIAGTLIPIGCVRRQSDNVLTFYISAYIQAYALYNTQINAEQVSALTTAMNAL